MSTPSASLSSDQLAAERVAEGKFAHDPHPATPLGEHGDDHHGFAHVSPISTLLAVFVSLVVLTVITWVVAFLETGGAEVFIALFVATIKAGLVCTWFMHLRYDKPLNALLFGFSTVFLGLFLVLTISDASAYQNQLESQDLLVESVEKNREAAAMLEAAPEAEAGADSMEGRPE